MLSIVVIIYNFIQIVNVNSFYNVLGYSLNCDLRLHAEYKYTMV